jgi:hypothetical protein
MKLVNLKLYFLLTEIDELPAMHNPTKEPKIKTMDAFYEALETDQDLDDEGRFKAVF